MASGLQYKNDFGTSGGYSNGVSSGRVANWTNTGLSGSHTTVVYWDDKWNGSNSRVYMTVIDSWKGTINADHSITINFHSSYSMNRTNIHGSSNCSGYYLRDGKIYTNNRSQLFRTYQNCITRTGTFSSGSKDWTLTLAHGQSTSEGSFFVINSTHGMPDSGTYTDYISGGVAFRNTLPAAPYAPVTTLNCSYVPNTIKGDVKFNVNDWGCPGGGDPANVCKYTSSVEWATNPDFTNIIAHGTGEKSLSPNTTYYISATASNGNKTTTKNCSFTTLATSSVYNYKFKSDQVSSLTIQSNYGNGACEISTVLQIREKGASNWNDYTTTSVPGVNTVVLRNYIVRGKQYEARTVTTNCAGTYTSDIYGFTPPPADSIVGQITTHNDSLDASGLTTTLDWCYKVTAYTLDQPSPSKPIHSHLEYRVEGQEQWTTLDDVVSTTSPVKICGQELGLACGSTYYIRSYQKIGTIESYSPVVTHLTAACAALNNCVCDNINYATELICQTLNKIKNGNKTIYANCQTKELCDPYSQTPTYESILSRITRFSQMATCLICSLSSLEFEGGQDNEVYTATEPGKRGHFVPLSQEVTEDDDRLISAYGAKEAINKLLNSVFGPIGTYEYYAESLDDLELQSSRKSGSDKDAKHYEVKEGDKGVVGDIYYTYTKGKWVETGTVPYLKDLGLINILKGDYALHEFYWWDAKWNMFDAETKELKRRLTALEENKDDIVYNIEDGHINMMALPIAYSDNQVFAAVKSAYASQDTVVYLYEGGTGPTPSTCFHLNVDLLDSNIGLC